MELVEQLIDKIQKETGCRRWPAAVAFPLWDNVFGQAGLLDICLCEADIAHLSSRQRQALSLALAGWYSNSNYEPLLQQLMGEDYAAVQAMLDSFS